MRPKRLAQLSDVAIALGLRRGFRIPPDPDVVVAQRVGAVAEQLIVAVAFPADQPLHASSQRQKLPFPARDDFQRHDGDEEGHLCGVSTVVGLPVR